LNKAGLQDDHDPNDIGQRQNNEPSISSDSNTYKVPPGNHDAEKND
jgi:hypothetical protein